MKEIKICKMKLSDFATVIMGQSPSSNFYNEEGKGLPFFQGVTDFSYKYPNETFWTTVAPKKAEINDVLFSVRAPVGDVNIANKKCCIGRGIAAIRSKTNQIDYLYYLLKYQSIKIQRLGTGAVYDAIKKSDLENILLDVFEDPNSQFQAGSLLVLYDDLIDTNRRRIQLSEESAGLLFREWFVYFRFPGHEKVKIVNGVPKGWERGKVKDLGDIVTGKTPSKKNASNFNGAIPFIKTPDMHQSSIIINAEESLSEIGANSQKNKYLPPWSILVSCIGTVGVVAMNLLRAQTNQQINSVIPKEDIYRYYSFFCLSRLKLLLEAVGGGSTMANVNKNKFENLDIIIPPDTILENFDKIVDPLFKHVSLLTLQNRKLAQARDLLLPRLMNGAIEVSESNIEISKEEET